MSRAAQTNKKKTPRELYLIKVARRGRGLQAAVHHTKKGNMVVPRGSSS